MAAILVVDDEPDVRDVVAGILLAGGYTVFAAADGYEALRILDEHHIDIMLTDIRMPGPAESTSRGKPT